VLRLSLLSDSERIQVAELLKLFGIDVWAIGNGKKVALNIKTFPPAAIKVLVAFLNEGEAKQKECLPHLN
jgi:hypothetical protein